MPELRSLLFTKLSSRGMKNVWKPATQRSMPYTPNYEKNSKKISV